MRRHDVAPHRLTYLMILFLTLCLGVPVLAQEGDGQEESEAEEPTEFEETIVVVGTRTEGRTVTASPVPVDVIPEAELVGQGVNDLTDRIRTVVPSYNVGTQPISDAATLVRPANLRGLAPDHTLILVNGKRRHRSAVIAWLGNGISDGSQGTGHFHHPVHRAPPGRGPARRRLGPVRLRCDRRRPQLPAQGREFRRQHRGAIRASSRTRTPAPARASAASTRSRARRARRTPSPPTSACRWARTASST